MSDIGLFLKDGIIDIEFEDGDIEIDVSLKTAKLISLFTDKRADPDELPLSFADDPRGYWGDVLEEDGFQLGSKLWLLKRSKKSPKLTEEVRSYIFEALKWLKDDEHVSNIEIEVFADSKDNLFSKIKTDDEVMTYRNTNAF